MKRCFTWWLLAVACVSPGLAGPQLQLLATQEPQRVFGDAAQNISVTFSNAGDEAFDATVRMRVFQTTSATAVQIGQWPWKELRVLPGQTLLESAPLNFPAVNADTKFMVQWLADTNQVIGTTGVAVYATNLLDELKRMFVGSNVGVLDPNGALKPALKQHGLEFLNLDETCLDDFAGRLAIIGPFQSRAQMREDLAQSIRRIAGRGAAVVWLLPPSDPTDEITPSFYLVPGRKGAVVVVRPELVADFSANPAAQLHFVQFCKLALRPEPFDLPAFASLP